MNLQLAATYSHLLRENIEPLDKRSCEKQNSFAHKCFCVLFALIIFFVGLPSLVTAQAVLPKSLLVNSPGVTDYVLPSDIADMYVTISGAQGGSVNYSCPYPGGSGTVISTHFFADFCSSHGILPGGTIRLIVGGQGESVNVQGRNAAGGGGGSALLYKAPGSDTWIILAAAGGGGGAAYSLIEGDCHGENGFPGEFNTNGSDGIGIIDEVGGAGGTDGNGGNGYLLISYGGGGALSDGVTVGNQGCNGRAGFPNGGLEANCNDIFTTRGGFGFGSGGAGVNGGGGGGGSYIGGGAGGGGGSYLVSWAPRLDTAHTTGNGQISIFCDNGVIPHPVSVASATLPGLQVPGCDILNSVGFGFSTIEKTTTLSQFNSAGGVITSGNCGIQSISYIDVTDPNNSSGIVNRTFTIIDTGNTKVTCNQVITIVDPGIAATISPAAQTICTNAAPAAISVDAAAQFGITIQWSKGGDASFVDADIIPGATSLSYTPPPSATADFTYYFAKITDNCGTITIKRATVGMLAQAITWYKDADNDGYSDGTTKTQCNQPKDYKQATDLTAITGDCNDDDPEINPATEWFLDADNDGYYSSLQIGGRQQCESPGQGWKYKGLLGGGDCNDNDPAINPATIWYLDADNDGYHDKLYIGTPSCTPPLDGRHYITTTKGPDCNDNDATYNPETVWVIDQDGDGYYTGTPYTGCLFIGANPGYVRKTNLLPGDCDDNDPAVNPQTVWVLDADGDGYYTGSPVTSCTLPGTGYVIKTNQQAGDCDDNDVTVHVPVQYYIDADRDGYGSTATAMLCSSTAPVGYSTNNTDINDADPTVHTSTTTITGVTSSLNPSCAGSNVTFTATVTFNGNPVTTGSVAFVLDGNTILAAAVPLDANGQATYSGNTLPAGSHTINVGYSGATGFATSNETVNQTINTPATVSFSGLAPSYCANAGTVTLTGSPAGGLFSGPGISDNTFNPATAGTGGPYTITYSYTDGNECSSSSSQQVTVNAVATATISGSMAVCLGAPSPNITFTGSGGTAPYTFTYTLNDVPPQTVTTSTGSSVTVAVPTNNAGTLSYNLVSVQDASSTQCSQVANGQAATVTVNPSPDATITTGSPITAVSSGNIASVPDAGTGATYSWTISNGTISGATDTKSITYKAGNSGSVQLNVSVTSGSNCGLVTGSVKVPITALPCPNPAISVASSVCSATTGNNASVADAGTGASYVWSTTNGAITGGAGKRQISFTAASNKYADYDDDDYVKLSVKVTNASGGCTESSGTYKIFISPIPSATISTPITVCSLSANNYASVAFAGTGATYQWTITNGSITSGAGTRSVWYSAGTSGSVTLAITVKNSKGCSTSSGNKTVIIAALPIANITAAASVCGGSGSNTASVANGASGTKYYWSISNGGINSGSSSNSISYTAGSSGSVSLSVTVTNSSGCKTNSGNKLVTIIAAPNAPITTSSVVCSGSTGNSASVPSAGSGASYSWTITGGTISAGTGTSSVKYSAATSGYVTLGITVTNSNGCKKSLSKKITIAANVIPTFAQIGPVCKASNAPSLPIKSTNDIPGSWSPSTISTASPATTTYTFTPAAGQCASTTIIKITVNNCTTLPGARIVSNKPTISKAALSMDVLILPNPSENFFTLLIKGNRKEVAEVRVLDVQGRWLDHFRLSTGSSIQFGGNYAHGTYIVQVIQGREQKQLKLIKL